MSQFTIQEQFNQYKDALQHMHELSHDIDAAIGQTEINAFYEKRSHDKKKLTYLTHGLIESLNDMGFKYPLDYPVQGRMAYIFTQGGQLLFEYH